MKTKVLIAEDEAIVAADLAGKLARLGYEVAGTTARGEEALVLARDRRPDVVLMDIRLAGAMDGIAAAETIRTDCDLPVIYLTAHSDPATLERAQLTEPFGYILKPFDERELRTGIEMACYRHRLDRQLRESEARLRLALDAAEQGEWEIDLAGGKVTLSSRVATIFGLDAGRGEGDLADWRPFVVAEDQASVAQALETAARTGDASRLEFRILRQADGEQRWVRCEGRLYRAGAGRTDRLVGVIRDITESKRVEQAREAANRDLARINRAMVGRELRMVELKKEVNEMSVRAGGPPRYSLEFEEQKT